MQKVGEVHDTPRNASRAPLPQSPLGSGVATTAQALDGARTAARTVPAGDVRGRAWAVGAPTRDATAASGTLAATTPQRRRRNRSIAPRTAILLADDAGAWWSTATVIVAGCSARWLGDWTRWSTLASRGSSEQGVGRAQRTHEDRSLAHSGQTSENGYGVPDSGRAVTGCRVRASLGSRRGESDLK